MFGRQRMRTSYVCSFCGKNQAQVGHLIAGPGGVYVCDECIALFNVQDSGGEVQSASANTKVEMVARCSFCGKKEKQVQRLVTGPHQVNICSECIDLCREIIEEENSIRK